MQGFQSLDWPFARFDFQTLVITQSITESTTSYTLRPKQVESGPPGLLAANDEKASPKDDFQVQLQTIPAHLLFA